MSKKSKNKRTRQTRKCNAFVEREDRRCTKPCLPKAQYCWHHYPKKEQVVFLFLGTIIGLLLPLLLTQPLRIFLSQFWPLYYLDNYQPRLVSLQPDVRANDRIDIECKSFTAEFMERGSGLDLTNSTVNIYFVHGKSHESISGSFDKTTNSIVFRPAKPLGGGQYQLEIDCLDKAGNLFKLTKPFFILEREPLRFTLTWAPYKSSPLRDTFSKSTSRSVYPSFEDFYSLYVYSLAIMNESQDAELTDIYMYILTPEPVYECVDLIALNTQGSNTRPNGSGITNSHIISIKRIGPQGGIHYAFLAGQPLGPLDRMKHVDITGTYFLDVYGSREHRRITKQLTLD